MKNLSVRCIIVLFIVMLSLVREGSAQITLTTCEKPSQNLRWSSGWNEAYPQAGVDVIRCRMGGAWTSWWFGFRNRYNQKVKITFTKRSADGDRRTTYIYVDANSKNEDTNMGFDEDPSIRVLKIEFVVNATDTTRTKPTAERGVTSNAGRSNPPATVATYDVGTVLLGKGLPPDFPAKVSSLVDKLEQRSANNKERESYKHNNVGHELLRAGKLDEAEKKFYEALKWGAYFYPYFGLAQIANKRGKKQEAIDLYLIAWSLLPDKERGPIKREEFLLLDIAELYEEIKDYKNAIAVYDAMVRKDMPYYAREVERVRNLVARAGLPANSRVPDTEKTLVLSAIRTNEPIRCAAGSWDCPFSVRVINQAGSPVSGVKVAWRVPGAQHTYVSVSDANGIATASNIYAYPDTGERVQTAQLAEPGVTVGHHPNGGVAGRGSVIEFRFIQFTAQIRPVDEWMGWSNAVTLDRENELKALVTKFTRISSNASTFNELCKQVTKVCVQVIDWGGKIVPCASGRDGSRLALCR